MRSSTAYTRGRTPRRGLGVSRLFPQVHHAARVDALQRTLYLSAALSLSSSSGARSLSPPLPLSLLLSRRTAMRACDVGRGAPVIPGDKRRGPTFAGRHRHARNPIIGEEIRCRPVQYAHSGQLPSDVYTTYRERGTVIARPGWYKTKNTQRRERHEKKGIDRGLLFQTTC